MSRAHSQQLVLIKVTIRSLKGAACPLHCPHSMPYASWHYDCNNNSRPTWYETWWNRWINDNVTTGRLVEDAWHSMWVGLIFRIDGHAVCPFTFHHRRPSHNPVLAHILNSWCSVQKYRAPSNRRLWWLKCILSPAVVFIRQRFSHWVVFSLSHHWTTSDRVW